MPRTQDGDDKADVRKTLYRGFGEGNQQHRVNGLRWGLDNWLYVGNGDSGGMIKAMESLTSRAQREADGTRSVPTTGSQRQRPRPADPPRHGRARRDQSGQTQFGRERDDWGNWFGGNNSNPMWHYTLDDHYLRRNPHFAPPRVRKQVSVVARRGARLSAEQDAGPVQRLQHGQPLHVGLQPDDLSRRAARAGVLRQHLRLRAGAQPGAPRDRHAAGNDVHQPAGRRRAAERVPGLRGQLVPPEHGPHRPGRGAVGRRHVPLRDRASEVDSARLPEASSTCGPATTRGGSTASIPQTPSRGRSPGSTSSTRPAWSRLSIRPTARSATWRSRCCSGRPIRRQSSRS